MILSAVAWCAAAQACSPPLDGSEFTCPDSLDDVKLPREELKGEIDIWNVNHLMSIEHMFIRNARRQKMEENMTQPVDALDAALQNYNNNLNN